MRLQGIGDKEAGPVLRVLYRMVRRKIGRVVRPVRIQAYHPRVLWATSAMELGQETSRRVPRDLKTLAALKVAQMVGCPF